jgi:GPH family glycoside/pentoside/hexuronide:cation symporter
MKIGKNLCLYIATSIILLSAASTWFTFRPDLPYLMLLNGALIGVGYAGLWLMIPSMQVDVVDYDELYTGERREGSFASIFSWVLKLSFCMGYLIAGPLIEMTGFDAALGGEQATEVLNKMRVGYLVIPVAALVAALMILKYFPINRAKAAEIRNELETRRGVI